MKNKVTVSFLAIVLLFATTPLTAQENALFMQKELKRAYQNNTRSYNGNPGENYFQNRTDYKIDAEFDPFSRLLTGYEIITFTNNSPDTLKRIIVRLYANILKKGATRRMTINPTDVNDGVQISKLKIGAVEIDLENKTPYLDQNNLYVNLPEPLPPLSKTEVEINWNYTFQANSNLREGRYHETSYFIAFWYPKIAVYDDLYGWNRHVYNGEQEFYHEYGDFEVSITVPADFYVWASGVLQNEKEVLKADKLALYNESKTTDEIIRILEEADVDRGDLPRSSMKKTWQFKAVYLPDFAFALSDTFLWDATSVQIGEKRVHVHAVYYKNSKDFSEVAQISSETIRLLSQTVIGVDYPYPQMTAFNGHYGMEFPMMVNDGDAETRNETLFVTSHEITHTYFPFYVGVNEERNAWIDEGFATFLPKEIEDSLSHDEGYNAFLSNLRTYSYYAGSKYDLPLMVSSDQMTGITYRYGTYGRSAVALYVLKDILGPEVFQKGLIAFINRWAGKHPTSYDLFFTFNDVSGQDLSWFWNPWFFEFGYPDLSVNKVIQKGKRYSVEVESAGNFPTPVKLLLTFEDGSTKEVNESTMIWASGEKTIYIPFESEKKVKQVEINAETVPDNNKNNNVFQLSP